jgi:excisionase family DNA binding protein
MARKRVILETIQPYQAPATLDSELLTREEVATILKLKPSTVYELTRRRTRTPLPFLKVGKYLRFRPSEVYNWLEGCRGRAAA